MYICNIHLYVYIQNGYNNSVDVQNVFIRNIYKMYKMDVCESVCLVHLIDAHIWRDVCRQAIWLYLDVMGGRRRMRIDATNVLIATFH